jgi:hypothetical protein
MYKMKNLREPVTQNRRTRQLAQRKAQIKALTHRRRSRAFYSRRASPYKFSYPRPPRDFSRRYLPHRAALFLSLPRRTAFAPVTPFSGGGDGSGSSRRPRGAVPEGAGHPYDAHRGRAPRHQELRFPDGALRIQPPY